MRFFARFAPGRAYQDLRVFLAQRQPYELWFLIAAMAVTAGAIALFARNDIPVEYKPPEITYVKQWRLDRTDAEIKAQQKIDQVQKDKDDAEIKRLQDARRAHFKKLGQELDKLGF